MRRARWITVLLVALAAGCAGAGAPTTPTTPSTGAGPEGGVQVQRRAFAAGGGSGIVASSRYPGVSWAIRDRGGRDRPGRPGNALYAFKVVDGRVGVLAGQGPGPTNVEGVAFTYGGHDLNLLAENRDVFFVPAGAYER